MPNTVLPLLSYINLNIPIVLVVVRHCLQTSCRYDVVYKLLWGVWFKNKLWGCCCVKFIAVPSFVCQFELVSYIPYLFTKFHASKHSGKRDTQTCMPYINVWAEVVRGFPKRGVYKNFNMPIPCMSPNSISLLIFRIM